MAGNMAGVDEGDGGERRIGQVVVVAICIVSLVVAGALAPTIGSPLRGGPPLNASELGGGELARALQNQSGSQPGELPSELQSGSGTPNVVASPENYQVGGQEALSDFRSQNQQIQFVVESPKNTYYRVGAYQSFDGYGWSRTDEQTSFSGAVPGSTPPGEEIQMRITLNASAYSVPVAWKPTAVNGPVPLSVRDTGGIVPREALQSGQSFTVTAVEPTRDPSVLADTNYDYPSEIENTYLQVDDNVSDRTVALADRVTADASNPYEEAKAIEEWLEANKEYSLNATTDPDRPVTKQFLFEMDAGYCQYFASSMAVMLRSQGIPARYVVGYAPGTQVGEDTYAVSGAQAHAWVEVYFEGVGWVRFDPTPSAGRQAADERVANQSSLEESFQQSDASESVNESDFEPSGGDGNDTGGETETTTTTGGDTTTGDGDSETTDEGTGIDDGTSTDDGSTTTTSNGDDDSDDGDDDSNDGDDSDDSDDSTVPPMNVSLNRTAAPGIDVTVTVTRAGEPVSGAAVYFNDRYVGTTNYEGEVEGTVPYTRNLTIRAKDPSASVRATKQPPPGSTLATGRSTLGPEWPTLTTKHSTLDSTRSRSASTNAFTPRDARRYALDELAESAFESRGLNLPGNDSNETTREFELAADMTFSLSDDPVPGSTVSVQVSIDGNPVPDAAVSMEGERVGRTNESGWVELSLPDDRENVTLTARRGEVSDSATVVLFTNVNVTTSGAAVPGSTLAVEARYRGEAVSDAAVFVDGERVATTDASGSATVDVPIEAAESVTVRVEDGVLSGSEERDVVTDASIEFATPPAPGADVELSVSAANESVEGASVAVAGERVATTDASGTATVTIPANAAGNVTVSATLGSLSATRDVDLFEPNLSVTPAYLVTLPGAPATVNVTDGGQPVSNATVALGDAQAKTGTDGTAEFTLPMQNAVTVRASALGTSTSTRLDWLFLRLVGVLLGAAFVAVVAFGTVFQDGRLGRFATRVRSLARRAGQSAVDALFAIASRIDDWLSKLPAVPEMLRSFVERLVNKPVETVRAVASAAYAKAAAIVLVVVAWLLELLGGNDEGADSAAGSAKSAAVAADGDGEEGRSLSVRAAWRVLVSLVSPPRLRTRTPGEIARMALDRGFPPAPVRTVTDAYRRAVYGDRPPEDAELERVRDAATELEGKQGDDETGDGAGTGTESVGRTEGGAD